MTEKEKRLADVMKRVQKIRRQAAVLSDRTDTMFVPNSEMRRRCENLADKAAQLSGEAKRLADHYRNL